MHFIDFISTLTHIPDSQRKRFERLVAVKQYAKGADFVSEGQVPKTIAFVIRGVFRYYYTDKNGTEFTKGFFPEGSLLSSYSAILEGRGSYFAIEALEDSIVQTVDYLKFRALFEEDPCWNEFLVKMLEKGYMAKEDRERQFLLFDAEERYAVFLKRYPDLDMRIKQSLIASYLGIAPESLSRIRKKMGLLT